MQVDWTDFAPTSAMPSTVTANDGTVVSFALGGQTNLLEPGYVGNIRTGARGLLTDYMALGMRGARNGNGVTLTMTFSTPVQVCFMLTDVDRYGPAWEDTVTITASVGGANVAITAGDLAPQGEVRSP